MMLEWGTKANATPVTPASILDCRAAAMSKATISAVFFGLAFAATAPAECPICPGEAQIEVMVPRDGIEPPTLRFSIACSTN